MEQRLFIRSDNGDDYRVQQPQGFREDDGKRQVDSEHDGQFDSPLQVDIWGDEKDTGRRNSLPGVVENSVTTDVFKESVAQRVIVEENNGRHGKAGGGYVRKFDGEFINLQVIDAAALT